MRAYPPFVYVGILLLCGFIGWAAAAITGGDASAQSNGTGYGALVGLVLAVVFYFVTRRK